MQNILKQFVKGLRAPYLTSQATAASTEPPFATGHENESVAEHLGTINDNSKDGFGNALWDDGAPKSNTMTVEEKIPPAF